ncbi:MAG TPA: hypothetical protein VFA33_06480 [Bryobacteraceae bacterium]|nr:hypothetical protein [Bryobacteraceae bacterium]
MTDPSPFSILDESAAAARNRQRVRPMRAPNAVRRGLAAFRKACQKRMPATMENVLFFGGLASVVGGCWMVWHPLAPLVGGGLAVWVSMLASMERESK